MRQIEIKQTIYEPGDLLNIEEVDIDKLSTVSESKKKAVLQGSKTIFIMKTMVSKSNSLVSYKVMSESGLYTRLRHDELKDARFIRNMKDFADFFGSIEE